MEEDTKGLYILVGKPKNKIYVIFHLLVPQCDEGWRLKDKGD
jgi:hypothetical protein